MDEVEIKKLDDEWGEYFEDMIKSADKILKEKVKKYPMDEWRIKQFLLGWTKHHLSRLKKKKRLKTKKLAYWYACVTLETTANLANDKKDGVK